MGDLATPEIDGVYYFKLVSEKKCSDAEAAASTGPACVRTGTQMMNTPITSPAPVNGIDTFQDRICGHDCSLVTCSYELLGGSGRSNPTGTQSNERCCCIPMRDELA